MPNDHRKQENRRLKLSSIVARLPMYRFLDESHAILLKLDPIWNQWLKQNLPALQFCAAHLSSFDTRNRATLTICADNATTAALLKNHKDSMLNALNKRLSAQPIELIKIRVDPSAATKVSQHHRKLTESEDSTLSYTPPTRESIDSIESLQKTIKNPDLAETLGNLAETLKKLS